MSMEFFKRAKAVRLKSQHNKYLIASDDEESVKQSRNGSSKKARWTVEPVDGKPGKIRLKSCFSWKYLSSSKDPFLLGMTGKRVCQSSPRLRVDPTVEWEPVKEGSRVKLMAYNGNFLRANGGNIPPWHNSVTHDVPSTSVTLDWVLWTVDVLEIDFDLSGSTEEVHGSTVGFVECNAGDPHPHPQPQGGFSRNSSFSSSASNEVGSVDSSSAEIPAPSPRASPEASEKPTRVSPLVQHVHTESKHSNSFNKLKSMLDGLQDLLDDGTEGDDHTKPDSPGSLESIPSHPHPLEVKMAKQTLKELNNMDFGTVLASGRDKKLEKAVKTLVADAKTSPIGQVPNELTNLQGQFESMKQDHGSASQDLIEYTAFSTRKLEVKAELKKYAAKAHELETLEVGFSNMLMTARAKREELLKQLEEVENNIKAAEIAQADNTVEIEEVIASIGEKSTSLREMEEKEKLWKTRKFEAERTLERVEEEWVKMKSEFVDV